MLVDAFSHFVLELYNVDSNFALAYFSFFRYFDQFPHSSDILTSISKNIWVASNKTRKVISLSTRINALWRTVTTIFVLTGVAKTGAV